MGKMHKTPIKSKESLTEKNQGPEETCIEGEKIKQQIGRKLACLSAWDN